MCHVCILKSTEADERVRVSLSACGQKASNVQPYALESEYTDLMYVHTHKISSSISHITTTSIPNHDTLIVPLHRTSLSKTLAAHAAEHYPTSTHAIVPFNTSTSTTSLAILLVSNKYSPSNFWNGRLRTVYLYDPAQGTITGTLKCDVHYYEDGNVRLQAGKMLPATAVGASAGEVMRVVARVEKGWQEEMNRGFGRLSEGEF